MTRLWRFSRLATERHYLQMYPRWKRGSGSPFGVPVCVRKHLFVWVQGGGVMSEMTHSRPPLTRLNYSGIAWCRPEVVAHPESPAGIIPPLWIFFKGHGGFSFLSLLAAEERNWSWWPIEDIVFLSLGFCGAFSTLPLEARVLKGGPHSAAKTHTTRR